ncbi:MAG: NAD-dependent epimerase/dehydratase family protein [Bryobacterales bacterium]|nr:NAD-dependent epimerase/dehydratase family protein [Bryobacterales bacterium]
MTVFVTGGTGYMGSRLIARLCARGHAVRALVRAGSESKLPPGPTLVRGDALDAGTYAGHVRGSDVFVHLIGVAHPSPSKAKQFLAIDLPSVEAAVDAAKTAGVDRFVYLSVAQPAPVMKDFVSVRARGEALICEAGLNAVFLRPWYVLGPGHWWPVALIPLYWTSERIPSSRDTARRLGLVTIRQMTTALVKAVESRDEGVQIIDVPAIRACADIPVPSPGCHPR